MRFDAALGQSLQAIKLSSEVDEPHAASGAYYWASTIQRLTGDSDGARLHATGGLALAETLRDRFRLMGFLLANGELARLQGDWDAAREFSERGISEAPREAVFLALRAMLEHQVGDVGQGESYLERLLDHLESAPFEPTFLDIYCAMAVPAVARITGKKTHLKTAEELLKGALSSHHATRLVATAAGAGLGAISVQTGDTNDQKTRYEALNGVGDMLLCQVGTSELLGSLARSIGELERSAEHFEAAVSLYKRAGYRPELARACAEYADLLLQRADEGDAEKAAWLLDEALSIAGELGMKPLMERALNSQQV